MKITVTSCATSAIMAVLFCFISPNLTVFAQLKLARLVSDHFILQRQDPIPVWG